ncbi:MAG: hypothetical protein D3903_12065 [Candidatus Electrothrix sp. GM3_4]|nr:hypothetical protein [Candidatus Electrothrix sp. GM3_4]
MSIVRLLRRLPDNLVRKVYYQLVTSALRLRYAMEIKNLEVLRPYLEDEGKGVLILSNHLSFLDGILIASPIVSQYKNRPMIYPSVVERFYPRDPESLIKHFFDLSHGIRVPKYGKKESIRFKHLLEEAIEQTISQVEAGGNVLFFPEGGLKKDARHSFRGVSGLHRILQKKNDIPLLFCRLEGLWGSSFSHAVTGKEPRLNEVLCQGMRQTCKNRIFFNPKRKVGLHFFEEPKGFPRQGSRQEVNAFLEDWYNAGYPEGREPVVSVPLV